MRFIRGLPGTLACTAVVEETSIELGMPVSVSVINAAGTVVASGIADSTSTGVYTFLLPAQTVLSPLTTTWTGSAGTMTTYDAVVGAPLFSLPDLRAADEAFTNTSLFPTSALVAAREAVTDEFAAICGRSFVRCGGSYAAPLGEFGTALLPVTDVDVLLSADVDGNPIDVSTLAVETDGLVSGLPVYTAYTLGLLWGVWDGLYSQFTPGPGLLTISYEYGFNTVPSDIYRAALIRARYILGAQRSGIPDRATSYSAVEGGTYSLATPGSGVWQTGVPEVDAILARWTIRPKGVAVA